MNQLAADRTERKWAVAVAVIVSAGALMVTPAHAGDLMSTICNNEVVSVGDRKGEVAVKCGKPLSKDQAAIATRASQGAAKRSGGKTESAKKTKIQQKTVKEKEETWTYVIDGSYRFFIFKEGKLARIETGRLAP